MRILIDGRYIQDAYPGIGRYTYNLVVALAKIVNGDRLIVLTNSRLPNRRYDLNYLASLPAVEIAECPVDRFLPVELLKLSPLVRKLRPDLFHSPFFLRPYPLFSPCIHTIYDLHPLHLPKQFSLVERIVFRFGMYLAIQKAAALLTISELSANALRRHWPALKSNCFVTPLAPDAVFRLLSTQEKRQEAKRLGMDECRYVFHVSNGMRHKNIELLLLAWKQFQKREATDIRKLVLAGDYGSRHLHIMGLARKLNITDSISILGNVDDKTLVALYNCADLFVFPSSVEGFGLPVIEAMSCGTPVLTTESTASASDSAKAVWTIPANALDPLIDALVHLLSNRMVRETLSAAGLVHAQRFTWEATARKTLQVYHTIMGVSELS